MKRTKKERIWKALPWFICSGGLIAFNLFVAAIAGPMRGGSPPYPFNVGIFPFPLVLGLCFLIPAIDELVRKE